MASKDHHRVLRRAILGHYPAVAFIGSGVSENYPAWETLIRKLARFVGHEGGERYIEQTQTPELDVVLAIADECSDDATETMRFMREQFQSEKARDERPAIFNSLVRAPFAYYVTTNYDTNIEDAYRDQYRRDLPTATFEDIDRVFAFLMEGGPFLLKLHGCARNGSRYILGYRDYQRIIFGDRRVRAVVDLVLGTRPVLFIGYGHRDPHISAYLDYRRQRLAHHSFPNFTYVKIDLKPFDVSTYYEERYRIKSVVLENWKDLQKELDQYAYLRIRDRYETIRQETGHLFHSFMQSADGRRAWDALMYATASSQLGMTYDVRKLWEKANRSPAHRTALQAEPALALLFHVAAAQMLKRHNDEDRAEQEFERVIELAASDSIIPPLRAMALRYAGIFHLSKEPPDIARANTLFTQTGSVLEGTDLVEETLDLRKWLALYRARVEGERAVASQELYEISQEAAACGYLKNAAWSLFNSAKEGLRDERMPLATPIAQKRLQEAVSIFERMNHLQGQAHSYLALAQLAAKADGLRLIRLAEAAATLAGDAWMEAKCQRAMEQLS